MKSGKITNIMEDVQVAAIKRDEVALWWLGQSGFLFKMGDGTIICVDAYLSDSVEKVNPLLKRNYLPPVTPTDLVCDYFFCTHNHLDHTDPDTIREINGKDEIVFVGPRNVVSQFELCNVPAKNIKLLEAGQQLDFEGFSVKAVFCIPNEEKVLDSVGYLFSFSNGVTIYHTGDTAYHPFLNYVNKYGVDVMLACINGKYGNMNGEEVAIFAHAVDPKVVIPTHFDLFAVNSEDPFRFTHLYDNSSITYLIPEVGKQCIFPAQVQSK